MMLVLRNLTMTECVELVDAMKADGFLSTGGYGQLSGWEGTHWGAVYCHPSGMWFAFDYLTPTSGEPRGTLHWRLTAPMTDLECRIYSNR